jgi:V/A-type H+-transporting ATPase subunit E
MAIAEIEKSITQEARTEASRIKLEAENSIRQLEKFHAEKKEEVKSAVLKEARRRAEEVKRSHIVPARLKAKKALLEEKQRILGKIYTEVKKSKKLSDAGISKLREETEVKAAAKLFGA